MPAGHPVRSPASDAALARAWPAAARDSARFPERLIPAFVLAAATILFLTRPEIKTVAAPLPFLAALIVFGLPHGAADGTLLLRSVDRGRAILLAAAYLAILVAAVVALLWRPAWTILSFLGLAVFHFGSADAEELAGGREPPRWLTASWAIGRGGLIVGLPFAVNPAGAWTPFARLSEMVTGQAASIPVSALAAAGATVGVVALAGLLIATAGPSRLDSPRPDPWDLGETALDTRYGSAIQLEKVLWHEPRGAQGGYTVSHSVYAQHATRLGPAEEDSASESEHPRRSETTPTPVLRPGGPAL